MAQRLIDEKILAEYEPSEEERLFQFDIQKYNGPKNSRFEPHGEGRAKFVTGGRYEGNFRKGFLHGKGRLVLQDCHRYEGWWRKGLKHGMGRMHYPDCSFYEGEFRKDQRYGVGKYKYPNGAVYEGNWFKNQRHGVGCYMFSRGDVTLKSAWIEGIARGPAEVIFEDCRYHGYWDEDNPRGPGCFSFDAKVMIKGKYYVNQREGCESKELVWQPLLIEKYEYSKLPLEPLPFPIDESDISEVSSSEDEDCNSDVVSNTEMDE
ncbi:radial spoke head 1 homolog [Armigeres subalbatus]|uniref:radial spoke head 1 homolog n=1 Tax=Armigeres subalbatus TaxID=124917 RepID=UPI002ECFBAF1